MVYREMTRPKIIEKIFLAYVDYFREGSSVEEAARKAMNQYYGEDRICEGKEYVPLHKLIAGFLVEKEYLDRPGDGNSLKMEDHEKLVVDEIQGLIGIHDIDGSVVDMERFDW